MALKFPQRSQSATAGKKLAIEMAEIFSSSSRFSISHDLLPFNFNPFLYRKPQGICNIWNLPAGSPNAGKRCARNAAATREFYFKHGFAVVLKGMEKSR
jgi:hypothetical protein